MDSQSKRRPSEKEEAPVSQSIAGERVDAEIVSEAKTGSNRASSPDMSAEEAERDLRAHVAFLRIGPDRIREIRALNFDGADARASGFFNDPDAAIKSIMGVPPRSQGVFVTLNCVLAVPDGCALNHIEKFPKRATANQDVVGLRLALVDVDPTCPTGCSATEQERNCAVALAADLQKHLKSVGITIAAEVDSGNGRQMVIRVDLAAEDSKLIERLLQSLAFRFDTKGAHVDLAVHDPARLHRLAGTWNRKGDNTSERPHRRSRLLYANADAPVVSRDVLEAAIGVVPPGKKGGRAQQTAEPKLSIPDLLARNGIAIYRESAWGDGYRWVLEDCPFDSSHTNHSAFVVQFADGGVTAGCLHNSCRGKGWNEFNATLAQPAPKRASDASAGTHSGERPVFSSDPAPLPDGLPDVLPFDYAILPEVLRRLVADICDRMQCPPDYVAVSALITLASVLGRKVAIRPKRHDDWIVVANLWGCVVGRPGVMKTPSIREPMQALQRIEDRAREKHEREVKAAGAKSFIAGARLKIAEQEVRSRLKDGASDESALEGLKLEPVEIPHRKRYVINDSTVEKLGELLNENPNGLLMFRDELVGWMRGLDRDGQEGARSFFLEAWDGGGSFTYDRIGRGTIDIQHAIVSVLGGIQPGILHEYVLNAVAQGQGDDGLLQRLQLIVWPDTKKEFVNVDRAPDKAARDAFTELVERLTQLHGSEVRAELDMGRARPIFFLSFAPDAQIAFNVWRERLETRIRAGTDHPAIESHLAKYRSLIPSLALLFHLAMDGTGPVSLDATVLSFHWAKYLESHARRVYAPVLNPDAPVVLALAQKLLERKLNDGFAWRDVYTKGWAGLATPEPVKRATEVLVDLDWLAEQVEKTPGAPKRRFWINPRIYERKDAAKPGQTDASAGPETPPPAGSSETPKGDWGTL